MEKLKQIRLKEKAKELERLKKQLEEQDLGPEETKQSEQTPQTAKKQLNQTSLSIANKNIWNW